MNKCQNIFKIYTRYVSEVCLSTAKYKMNISHCKSFKAILTPEVIVLKDIFIKYNHQLCLSGGPVRDILMGIIPDDLDFATCATPEDMKKIFLHEKIRILNKNGEKHGTITVRINDKINFEVTTLRIDKLTNGRHAEVEFTKNWSLDAHRRDLTINSMFLDLNGNLYDFCGGKRDLDERKVVFVGNPLERIREDYLRILRYFRFYGKIASTQNEHDCETLRVISENASGLSIISGERIWSELKKICTGNFADSLIKIIFETNVSPYVGLPAVLGPKQALEVENVFKRAQDLDPNPMTILSAIFSDLEELRLANKRLKLSNMEITIAAFILEQRARHDPYDLPEKLNNTDTSAVKYFTDLLVDDNTPKCRVKILEFFKYMGKPELLNFFTHLQLPKFPVSGNDLLNLGIRKSPQFSKILHDLRDRWKHSNFSLTRLELLDKIKLSKHDAV